MLTPFSWDLVVLVFYDSGLGRALFFTPLDIMLGLIFRLYVAHFLGNVCLCRPAVNVDGEISFNAILAESLMEFVQTLSVISSLLNATKLLVPRTFFFPLGENRRFMWFLSRGSVCSLCFFLTKIKGPVRLPLRILMVYSYSKQKIFRFL